MTFRKLNLIATTLSSAAVLCGAALSVRPAKADLYQLKSGGEVAGILVRKSDAGAFVVRTPDGVTLTIARRDIQRIVPEDPNLALYRERAKETPDTADAHRELARWCKERGLTKLKNHHFQRVIQLDPEDEEARLALGYQKTGSAWMTRDELMEARGMILDGGKYRTAQEIALRRREELRKETDADWFTKLRLWRGWLTSRREDRVAEGRAQILSVADPAAAPALAKLMASERDPWVYGILLGTLGELNHPVTVHTLVDASLHDDDDDVRRRSLEYLIRLDVPKSIIPYVKALKSKDNVIVNRAGEALRLLNDPEAISPLIDALNTEHKYKISGNSNSMNASFNRSGGGGFSMGGDGPKIVTQSHTNPNVLRALSYLTDGVDLDYDEIAWRNWYVSQKANQQYNSRRDD